MVFISARIIWWYFSAAVAIHAHDMKKNGDREGGPPVVARSRTLCVIEGDIESTHSQLFKLMKEEGFDLTVAHVNAKQETSLFEDEERLFDNVLLMIPNAPDWPSTNLRQNDLLNFVDAGGNLLLVGGNNAADDGGQVSTGGAIRRLALACGFDVHPEGSRVIDLANWDEPLGAIRTDAVVETGVIVSKPTEPLLFRGFGHRLHPENPFAFPILRGLLSSYSGKLRVRPSANAVHAAGLDVLLVSGIQAENNSRIVFVGSAAMLGDAFCRAQPSNGIFAKELINWTFQQSGVLEWSHLRHHKVGEHSPPAMYRIKDEIEFAIDLWETKNGTWEPLQRNDVQLEFVMGNAYIRLFLDPPTDGSATYSTVFTAPDRYGVFKFVIDHLRLGYSRVHVEVLAPLRNFKHDDYARFIPGAFPYYTTTIVTLGCSLLLVALTMYHTPTNSKQKEL